MDKSSGVYMEGKQIKKRRNLEWFYTLVGSALVVLALVLVLILFLQGETTVSGEDGNMIEGVQSLTCESEAFEYPLLPRDGAKKSSIKINVVMSNSRLDTISLVYKLFYDDMAQIERVLASSRINMNQRFADDALGIGALGATYSGLQDAAQMALYAKKQEINGITAKYFLLGGDTIHSKEALIRAYNNQGLDCVIKDNM